MIVLCVLQHLAAAAAIATATVTRKKQRLFQVINGNVNDC